MPIVPETCRDGVTVITGDGTFERISLAVSVKFWCGLEIDG